MKIRILSDLHLDINRKYPIDIFDPSIFTVIAGDLGGDFKKNAEWIKDNIQRGIFISGNHDAYTMDNTPLDDVKEYYHKEFPEDGEITYCDDDVGVISKTIGNVMIIADVMYTDYRFIVSPDDKGLTKKQLVERNMFRASPKFSGSYMNDFMFYTRKNKPTKNAHIYDPKLPKGCFYLRPKNYLKHFNSVFKKISKLVEENKDKDITLVAHHCLSEKCINDEYSKSSLNASYISPKDSWIKKHPNIKLIVSGHVHHRNVFNVGSTLYVLNPLGYCRDYQDKSWNPETQKQEDWTPNFYVDTDTWKITKEPYENTEKFDVIHKSEHNVNLALMSAFI